MTVTVTTNFNTPNNKLITAKPDSLLSLPSLQKPICHLVLHTQRQGIAEERKHLDSSFKSLIFLKSIKLPRALSGAGLSVTPEPAERGEAAGPRPLLRPSSRSRRSHGLPSLRGLRGDATKYSWNLSKGKKRWKSEFPLIGDTGTRFT